MKMLSRKKKKTVKSLNTKYQSELYLNNNCRREKSKLEIQNWTKKHEDVKCLLTQGKKKKNKTEEKETSQK